MTLFRVARFAALTALWAVLLNVRAYELRARLHCDGYEPALCWTPGNGHEPGYYRRGILAQHCARFRGHGGPCLAYRNHLGHVVRGGADFTPEVVA